MTALSLLICWTLVSQVGSSLGSNTTAPLGTNSNPAALSGSNFGSGALGGAAAPSTPLGSSTPNLNTPNFNNGAGFANSNSSLNNNAGFNSNTAALGSGFETATEADGKNYGWQINKLGELEYLIQISPSMLRDMQDPVQKNELESYIPKQLVGRIKRVVVSIGNEILPRTPSLLEVERLVPVTASLQPGRFQDLEGSVVHVNNPSDNGYQNFNHSQPSNLNPAAAGTAPLGSIAEQARSNSLMSTNSPNPNQGSLLDRMQSSGTGISSGRLAGSSAGSARLGNASTGYANNQNYPANAGGYGNTQDFNATASGTGFASQNNYNNAGNYAPLRNDVNGNRLAANTNATGSGFGNNYNQYGTNWQDDSRRFPSTQADYQGQLSPAANYLASNGQQRMDYPGTSPVADRNHSSQVQRPVVPARDGSLSNPNYLAQAYASQDNNYFFYVFFILSIAVNLWMVHLLRSLYMRYRNLLTSLRSQSSTTLG